MIIAVFALALCAAFALIGGLGAVIASESGTVSEAPHGAGYI